MSQKQLLEEARLLREARTQVFLSYGQKLLLVMIACCGFATLKWLGDQKDAEDRFRKARWKGRPDIVVSVVNQATLEEAEPKASDSAGTKPTGKQSVANVTMKQADANAATKQSANTATKPSVANTSLKQAGADATTKQSGAIEPCPSVIGPAPSYIGSAPSYFASREQMIVAMQELAEACVWANFRRTIKKATTQLEAAGDNPEVEKFSHFADYIAKEEALATITAKVARQHVGARLVSMQIEPEQRQPFKAVQGQSTWKNVTAQLSDRIRQAAGDDSNLYIFYEMLWYASLLTGVIASSILFVALLHALPLTSGEGYWTTRISEILKSIPSRSVIAIPFVAAAIGGGAFAGSVTATEPGGQGRGAAVKLLTTSEPAPPKMPGLPDAASEPWTYREGDSNTAIFYRGGGALAFRPPLMDLGTIEASLKTLNSNSAQLLDETRAARQSAALTLWLWTMPSLGDRAEPMAADALRRVEELARKQEELGRRIDALGDLKQLTQEVHTLAATMNTREQTIDGTLQSVQRRGDRQENVSAQSLGQTAAIDPRGFFARTFGKTYYAVGPLVPSAMDAYLKGVMSDAEREALVNMLTEMRKEPPCSENDFRINIREGLSKELRAEKIEKVEETVESFMRDHVPALLKICALPRY
jgi:hypothetical protein